MVIHQLRIELQLEENLQRAEELVGEEIIVIRSTLEEREVQAQDHLQEQVEIRNLIEGLAHRLEGAQEVDRLRWELRERQIEALRRDRLQIDQTDPLEQAQDHLRKDQAQRAVLLAEEEVENNFYF